MAVDQIARMMALDAAQHGGGGGGGTDNYNDLTNRPKINGVTLTGNKTASDLGIVENVQADWDEDDSTSPSYIQNKPNIPSGVVVDTTYDGTSQNAQAGTAVAQALQGSLKMISASNETATGNLDLTNEPISVFKNGEKVAGISRLIDLMFARIEPGTVIMFTRNDLFSEINTGRFLYRASDFPASGYTLSVGAYLTDSQIGTIFEDSKYSENTHVPIEKGSQDFITVTMGRTAWKDVTVTYQYVTIVFQADPTTSQFLCSYAFGVKLAKPPTADIVLEDRSTGKRYTVEQAQGVTVDQQYDAQSANAQSGTAVASAISGKISATDYATQTTGGTVKAWTTTDGSDTILHLATQ